MTLITGGSGSGKSAYAEQMVLAQGPAKRYYIATMKPWDEECRLRIARHRQIREGKSFETIECGQDLHFLSLEPSSVVLLECLSNLAANECFRKDEDWPEVKSRIMRGILHLQKQAEAFMIVTNEVFLDGTDYGEETKAYQQLLAALNRELAVLADEVVEVVFGIPVTVKKTGGERL